jgi:hypothetical protein
MSEGPLPSPDVAVRLCPASEPRRTRADLGCTVAEDRNEQPRLNEQMPSVDQPDRDENGEDPGLNAPLFMGSPTGTAQASGRTSRGLCWTRSELLRLLRPRRKLQA